MFRRCSGVSSRIVCCRWSLLVVVVLLFDVFLVRLVSLVFFHWRILCLCWFCVEKSRDSVAGFLDAW